MCYAFIYFIELMLSDAIIITTFNSSVENEIKNCAIIFKDIDKILLKKIF